QVLLAVMAAMTDPFERDDEYLRFKKYATEFLVARDELLERHISAQERPVWDKVRTKIDRGGFVQNKAVELILEEHIAEAYKVMHDEVIPTQEIVMDELTQMLELARGIVHNEISDASTDNRTTYLLVAILGGGALLIVSVIAVFVLNRTSQAEHALLEQSLRLRALYETTSLHGSNLDDQINSMLQRGTGLLGMEYAQVCCVDIEAQTNAIRYAYSALGESAMPGTVMRLADTFCSMTVSAEQPLAISYAAQSPYADQRCYLASGIESYIAAPVRMAGEVYGTVSFSSHLPRMLPFESRDIDLVNLIASWIGVTLERVEAQRELNVAKDAAEGASRAKSAFVANMSHEIRTPLTAIVGFSTALLDAGQSTDEREKAAKTIARASRHLTQVINDILDMSKIEAGQLQVELIEVDPFEVLAEIEAVVGTRAREKGLVFDINYHYPLPENIRSDPVRVKQILLNLCGNAIKFTEHGRVAIDVHADLAAQHMKFVITDTGVGMSNDEMQRLFQPFAQADVSTTRRFGGTGLGLCISRDLAEKLGGTIACGSDKGVGSRFEVTLAIGAIQPQWITHYRASDDTTSQIPAVPQLDGEILLAEDSADIQALIGMYVRRTGAGLRIVDNGQQAVECAMQHEYHLILMDVQMPVLDGLSAVRMLRQMGNTTPIVSLTANALREDRERCIAAGANEYLTKPVDLNLFYQTLAHFVPAIAAPQNIVDADDDDPEFKVLVEKFREGLPALLADIERAAAAQDWSALQSVLHKLKGMGGGFGFPQLSASSAAVLDALRTKAFEQAVKQLTELCRCIREVVPKTAAVTAAHEAAG
ncbi:MAG: response regulator, partial [Gammaproteobacteria bacterium]|nr:response regulator [Gammaproteobacteria bacterium]